MAKPYLPAAFAALLCLVAPGATARDVYTEPDAPMVAIAGGDTIRMRNPEDAKQAILVRLLDIYAREKGIVAEPAEVEAQAASIRGTLQADRLRWTARLEEVERRLRERSLTERERKSLLAERQVLNTLLGNGLPGQATTTPQEHPDIVRHLAAGFVKQWKVDRTLYLQYGGRIAVQPGGLEPHDAYRRFLEERLAKQDFQILAPELERVFWRRYAYDAPYKFLAPGSAEEAQAFRTPPWAAR